MSNLNINRINLVLTPANISTMKASINLAMGLIPATAVLTTSERNKGGDIDVTNKIFVEDALMELNSNGVTIMPSWFNTNHLTTDLRFFEQTDELISMYNNLLTRIKDAQRIAGREAFVAANVAYDQYKKAAHSGLPGAQESYDKLKVRYERFNTNKAKENP